MGAKLSVGIAKGEMALETALELLGTQAASDARAMIAAISSLPNSAETIRREGSSNPLVKDGHIGQQVTHQVVKKG